MSSSFDSRNALYCSDDHFRYTRLPYGISSAPSIFQKAMESLLQGISHVTVYIDNILITGETESDHLQSLEEVLKCLVKAGLGV